MSGRAARLKLEDFADATGLPLAALEHPLSQPPLTRTPTPCSLCEAREAEHKAALEQAQTLQSDIVKSLKVSLVEQLESLRADMHARQAKAFDAVLNALLPDLGDAVLKQKLSDALSQALRKDSPVTLHVSPDFELSDLSGHDDCRICPDPQLPTGRVIISQDEGELSLDTDAIVKACLSHFTPHHA